MRTGAPVLSLPLQELTKGIYTEDSCRVIASHALGAASGCGRWSPAMRGAGLDRPFQFRKGREMSLEQFVTQG